MKIKVTLLALFFVGFAMLWIPRSSPLPPGLTFAQINQPGGGGGSGTVTSVLGTANQITSDGSSTTPTLSIPSAFTAPGSVTATTLFRSPLGSITSVGYGNTTNTNTGLYFVNATAPALSINGTAYVLWTVSEERIARDNIRGWTSNATDATAALDTGVSRSAADVVAVGNGAAGNTTGKLKASGYISVGTKFTTNNGCTDSATAGGATAGTFTVGTTTCTEIVTMGDSATAPNGWSCTVVDITTLADVTNPHQTTSSATTATFVTGTVVSGDKIQFSCVGY